MLSFSEIEHRLKTWVNSNKRVVLGEPSAAVMIPIYNLNNQAYFILTRRSEKLRKHSGQISFPGGKIDPEDRDVFETARRETFEEIGLSDKEIISTIGAFDDFATPYYLAVTPIITLVKKPDPYVISEDEISEVIEVPIIDLFDETIHHIEYWEREGKTHEVNFFDWTLNGNRYNIWGATAGVIWKIVQILKLQKY